MFEKEEGELEGHVSLLNKKISQVSPAKKSASYKVYIEDPEGKSFSTKLSADVTTIGDAIAEAVSNFNHNLGVELPLGTHLYELYAAKNGKKDTGLPSF